MAPLPNLARLSLTVTTVPPTHAPHAYNDKDAEYEHALDDTDDDTDDDAYNNAAQEPPSRRHKTERGQFMSGPGFEPTPSAPRRRALPKPPLPPPPPPPTYTGPTIESGTRFQDVNWRRIVNALENGNGKESFSFTVHVQELPGGLRPPGRVWEVKMRLERQQYDLGRRLRTVLVIEPPGAPALDKRRCVEIVLGDHQTPGFVINSLFWDLAAGEETALCRRQVLPSSDWSDPNAHLGQGAIVLQIVDALAPLLGTHRLELIDGSRFAPDSLRGNPDVISSDMFMTDALALLRGYGYYEARGWFSSFLIRDPFIAENGHANPQRMSDHAHADLLWTEVVMNTPLNELHEAILNFPNTLEARWSDWSGSSFEEGFSPEFETHLYGVEACKRHAERAENYIVEMLAWCSSDFTADSVPVERDQWWGRWMDHFDELSIRDIRSQTMAKVVEMEDAQHVLYRFVDVPSERHRVVELIDSFMEDVWYRYIDTENPADSEDWNGEKYPGTTSQTLEKVIFTRYGGNPPYRSLKIEPGTGTGLPRVVLVDNRGDLTCENTAGIAAAPIRKRTIALEDTDDEDME